MPLTRSEKEAAVADISARLQKAEAIVVTDYRGLTVAQLGKLRKELRAKGAEFHVVKNSLTRLALAEVGVEAPADLTAGPTALVLLHEDLSGPTKTLQATAKETSLLAIRGGLMGSSVLDAKSVAALADLPTREQLYAQLVGVIQGPQRQLLGVLSAPSRDVLNVLNAKAAQEAA